MFCGKTKGTQKQQRREMEKGESERAWMKGSNDSASISFADPIRLDITLSPCHSRGLSTEYFSCTLSARTVCNVATTAMCREINLPFLSHAALCEQWSCLCMQHVHQHRSFIFISQSAASGLNIV